MTYDRNLLKLEEIQAFRAFLERQGIECRDGKGEFQLLQARTSQQCWAVINCNAKGGITTHPELAPWIKAFRTGERIASLAPEKTERDTFLEDLRDDMAMAALQGLLSNPNVLGKHPDSGRVIGPNTPALAAREAYRVADAMLEARKVKPSEAPRPAKKSDTWSKEWKANGYNHCMDQAAKALRHLANHERPSGGEQSFNSEHLFMIADELDYTKRELLAP